MCYVTEYKSRLLMGEDLYSRSALFADFGRDAAPDQRNALISQLRHRLKIRRQVHLLIGDLQLPADVTAMRFHRFGEIPSARAISFDVISRRINRQSATPTASDSLQAA